MQRMHDGQLLAGLAGGHRCKSLLSSTSGLHFAAAGTHCFLLLAEVHILKQLLHLQNRHTPSANVECLQDLEAYHHPDVLCISLFH
jgi:hypothetical protein